MELLFGSTTILDERSALMSSVGFDLPITVQVDPAVVSGGDVDPWPRDGRACQCTGSVTRQFDTHSEAVAWYATHGATVTASARDTLTWAVNGTPVATATATLQQVTPHRPTGVSVTVDYTFLCAPPAAT